MWFAARAHYTHSHWLLNLVYRLLTQQTEGSVTQPDVVSLDSVTMTIESMIQIRVHNLTLNLNPNPNPTKQHATVNIQLNTVTCLTYPEEFIRDMLLYCFRL